MDKRNIVNTLFILSFPVFGLGNYVSAISSPTAGYFLSVSFHFAIVLFYLIDLLYKREFQIRINSIYGWMTLYLISCAASLFIASAKGLPDPTFVLMVGKTILMFLPFQAFIIVSLYNEKQKDFLVRLTLIGLSLLLVFNLIGFFGLGLTNGVHSIEGRLNFPFLDGFYSGACLLAIINFLLLFYLKRNWQYPVRVLFLGGYFMANLAMLILINSRLTILIFFFVLGIYMIGLIRARGLFWLSQFTLPILLSSGFLIYELLQLPGLSSILQRVDVEDVTTFNGRAFLWRDAMDWLMYDQRGLLFGNGYRGHYFLDLITDVAKLWNEKETHHMHLHSTSLEILVSQGLIFYVIFCFLFYKAFEYYRDRNLKKRPDGAFIPIIVFLLFVLQVDTFVYLDSLGFIIFSLLLSRAVIIPKSNPREGIKVKPVRIKNYNSVLEFS
jgi:hypothetical protein